MNTDEKIVKALESLQAGQTRIEKTVSTLQADVKDMKQDIVVLKNGQAHNTTMVEAVLAGQTELQKTAARGTTGGTRLIDRLK